MTGTMIFQRRADMTDRATPDAASDTTDLFEIIRTTRSMRRLKPDPVPNAALDKRRLEAIEKLWSHEQEAARAERRGTEFA
jgi:hypothetical protein